MSLRVWDERVLPRLTDRSLRGPELDELRRAVCAGLTGRVLEIGFGSGLNVPWYPGGVTSVAAIEPSDLAWELSEGRRSASDVPVVRAGLDGQRLDLPDDSHDSALVTFSLCTVPDPLLALREARRVVRDGGRLHALEHGIAPEESVRRWQRRMEPVQRTVFAGLPPDPRRARPARVRRVAGRGPGAGLPARTGPLPAVDVRLPARGRLRSTSGRTVSVRDGGNRRGTAR